MFYRNLVLKLLNISSLIIIQAKYNYRVIKYETNHFVLLISFKSMNLLSCFAKNIPVSLSSAISLNIKRIKLLSSYLDTAPQIPELLRIIYYSYSLSFNTSIDSA